MSDEICRELRGFSWRDYETLLRTFLGAGYIFCNFDQFNPQSTNVILRHDIDFSIKAAINIARIESILGIKSHYFVLLNTEFYNLCSPSSQAIIEEIHTLGHEIGLHFDAAPYEDKIEDIQRAAARECKILEMIIAAPVKSISFHRPAKSIQGMQDRLAGRLHAYQPQFFSSVAYFSDSQGRFRFGHPLDSEAFETKSAMQLLTHPIWWTQESVADRLDLIDNFLEERNSLLAYEAVFNCLPYAERVANQLNKKNNGAGIDNFI